MPMSSNWKRIKIENNWINKKSNVKFGTRYFIVWWMFNEDKQKTIRRSACRITINLNENNSQEISWDFDFITNTQDRKIKPALHIL